MSRILQISLQAVLGSIIGAVIWSVFISIIVSLIIYKSGYIKIEMPMSGSLNPKILIITGTIFGLLQGLFIGLTVGIFDTDTLLKGAVIGFIITEISLLLFYTVSNLMVFFSEKDLARALDSIEIDNFIIFSILLFVPSVLIGMLNVKAYALIRSIV